MVIVRSPLRITLGGGGTDLPSYYRKHSGALVSAAIDKYVYVTVHKAFVEDYILKYSVLEKVKSIEDIEHNIIRESLREVGLCNGYLEITSLADIPAGTGLGSSGSFTTALLKALYTYTKQPVSTRFLAEQACKIEIDKLEGTIGKQDQYIAAFGGITSFEFLPNERVEIESVKLSSETMYNLEDGLMLFFTGYSRSAASILKNQDDKSKDGDDKMTQWLDFTKKLGLESKEALEAGNLVKFGELMNVHWESKKRRSGAMTNEAIERCYESALKNGAVGGKLVGAGGGGFLMFYTKDKEKLRHSMRLEGLEELRFRFDFDGTMVVAQ
ncbi:MAG: GHMP kinase [Oscillospiraceae bacterium]|nr:GHMP kinase [Oscillospiraceae bacterium]